MDDHYVVSVMWFFSYKEIPKVNLSNVIDLKVQYFAQWLGYTMDTSIILLMWSSKMSRKELASMNYL